MYIATNEEATVKGSIMNIMPRDIRRYMYNITLDDAEEIRIIQGQSIYIHYADGDYFPTVRGTLSKSKQNGITARKEHIEELLERITKSSLYSVKDEIRNGYITVDGGHRVGIAGTAVTERGQIEHIKNISAMTVRIANERLGVSDTVIRKIAGFDGIDNTLIISPPGCGKTTLLRDLVRNISNMGYCTAVADERCELAAMRDGQSPFDLGCRTTVIDACPKAEAMKMLLRSMSPNVIVTDELGTDGDAEAVFEILNSGVSIIATAHGRDTRQLMRKTAFERILKYFDTIVILSRRNGVGTVEEIMRGPQNA